MGRSSERRGQVEPVPALAAVFVVGVALAVYASGFAAALPGTRSHSVAEPTVDRVERAISTAGVVRPGALSTLGDVGPEGYHRNVTLEYADQRQTRGPTVAPGADAASRRVSVRVAPGRIRPGRLVVAVWT